jgi:hypothetical protein
LRRELQFEFTCQVLAFKFARIAPPICCSW